MDLSAAVVKKVGRQHTTKRTRRRIGNFIA
jgi:hypothetical protein